MRNRHENRGEPTERLGAGKTEMGEAFSMTAPLKVAVGQLLLECCDQKS